MLDGLLKEQVRSDPDIAGMLAAYKGHPAFFYQKAPADTDRGWQDSCFPRADYNIDMRYDPERKTSGALTINVWSSAESAAMPEDIERRLIALISGTFYTDPQRQTVSAVWSRSDAFSFEGNTQTNSTAPETFGVTLLFDLMEFPEQMTITPDPVQGLNLWTKCVCPDMNIIAFDALPPVWKPTDEHPAIYWRFANTAADNRQSYAVTWYNGVFAGHVITASVPERNRWTKAIVEKMQLAAEVVLSDCSPMFITRIAINPAADPLREGQISISANYGVLAQHRKETAQIPLNYAPAEVEGVTKEIGDDQ